MVPMGISVAPSMRHCACSQGSRTSTINSFSPRSSRSFTSFGVISRSFIYAPIALLVPVNQSADDREHHKNHDGNHDDTEDDAEQFSCTEFRHSRILCRAAIERRNIHNGGPRYNSVPDYWIKPLGEIHCFSTA